MNFLSKYTTCLSAAKSTQTPLRRGLEEFFERGLALPKEHTVTGRAWRAAELRLKSFDDLHKLWYLNLKERNLLSTQRAEAKRHGIQPTAFSNKSRVIKCKKNMARILFVLNERRIQFELAQQALKSQPALSTLPESVKSEIEPASIQNNPL